MGRNRSRDREDCLRKRKISHQAILDDWLQLPIRLLTVVLTVARKNLNDVDKTF